MKNKHTRLCTCIFAGVFLCSNLTVFASGTQDTTTFKQEQQYVSTDINQKTEFEELLENDNGKYILKNVDYEIISSIPVPKDNEIIEEKSINDLYEQSDAQFDEEIEIEKDGKKIKLKLDTVNFSDTTIKNRTELVSGSVEIKKQITKPVISENKEFSFVDKKLNKTLSPTLQFKNLETTSPNTWVSDVKMPVKIHLYESEFYKLQDKYVPYNAEKPHFKGFENELLQTVSLSPNSYKVDDFNWTSEVFEENGVKYRNAEIIGQRLISDYKLNYESTVNLENAPGYNAVATYIGTDTVDSDVSNHTIKATANYELEENSNHFIIISLALIVIIFFIVLSIYILNKQSKLKNKEK